MSGTIRVPDLPDLGAVTDDTSLVAEHTGTGRIVATALRDYMTTSGGGPFLPASGGTVNGDLTTAAGEDITSGQDVYVSRQLRIGAADGFVWSLYDNPSGIRIVSYAPSVFDSIDITGNRAWVGDLGALMTLNASGDLTTRASVTSPLIHSTGNLVADGTLTAGVINSPGAPMVIGTVTATAINASGGVTTSGDVTAGNVNVSGQVSMGAGFRLLVEGGGNHNMYFSAGWCLSWNPATGNLTYIRNGDNAALMSSIGATGEFVINGATAYKPGGGSWTAPSDSRIKTVTGDYTRGLADILQLQPKRFTYKGNDTLSEPEEGQSAPYTSSPNYIVAEAGTEFVGLVAQELEPVMPEMVREHTGYIDGVVKSDILTVDRSSLDLALVNAVKELEARIAALEAVRSAPTTKAG